MEIWDIEEGDKAPVEGLFENGRPDPAYAASLGLVQAPLGRRAAAFAVEYAVYLLLQVPLLIFMAPLLLKFLSGSISAYGFVNHPDFKLALIMAGVTTVFTLAYVLTQLFFHGTKGVTLGKAFFGLRSVNVRTLEKPGFFRVLLRNLLVFGAGIVPFGTVAVLLSTLFDKTGRGRGWHDKVGDLWLVDVRAGLHPYDEKRMRVARKTVAATPRAVREALPSLTSGSVAAYQPGGRLSAGVIGRSERDGGAAGPVGGALATPVSAGAAPAAPTPALIPPPPAAVPPTPAAVPGPAPVPPAAPAVPPMPAAPAAPVVPPRSVEPALAPPVAQVTVLHLDSGQQVAIDGPVVLGRNPKSPAGIEARGVVVADEQLSRTHVLIRPVAAGLEVTDLGSSNGTTVTHEGIERQLVAQQPSTVLPGDAIQIGQRTATVRRG